ncbi:hypothetical protein, partial [Dolichospermum sp. LEGE 00240]|uniref:hypothetical protein n=1 Tax=Dolichospermum sp. LEGE 00240 TaxID=1828603 RepID=UPI001D14FB8C
STPRAGKPQGGETPGRGNPAPTVYPLITQLNLITIIYLNFVVRASCPLELYKLNAQQLNSHLASTHPLGN